jgi:hypothetical protein
MCHAPLKTIHNLFLTCPFARAIWRNTAWPINTANFDLQPIGSWTKALLMPNQFLGISLNAIHGFQINTLVTMDHIWLARNKLVHRGAPLKPHSILKLIKLSFQHHSATWKSLSPSLGDWVPPPRGYHKVNFDVAIKPNYAIAATILRDHRGDILAACSKCLPSMEANQGEANAALLAVHPTSHFGSSSIILERDSLTTILAINYPHVASDWAPTPILADISQQLLFFQNWTALKISRCANYCAYHVAKWAALNCVFGSISSHSLILSSLRICNGKDLPL